MAQVLSVSSVELTLQKSNPPTILVEVHGTVGTPGWRNVRLERLEKVLSADGILDLDFVGDPPSGPVIQVIRPVTADFVIDPKEAEKIVGVLVHARTGNLLGTLAGPAPSASAFASHAANLGTVRTQALGEGGGTGALGEDVTTLAVGEENQWHTFASQWAESPPLTPQVESIAQVGAEKIPLWPTEKFPLATAEKFAQNLGEKNPLVREKLPFEDFIQNKPAGFGEGRPGPDQMGPMFFSPFGVR